MKAAQRQARVSVRGISGLFARKTGGSTASDVTNVWDGGSLRPEKLASPALVEDVTISRPFDPTRDNEILADLRRKVGRWRTTVTIEYTDTDLVKLGDPEVYPQALLVRVNDPDVDASSGEPMMLELVFACSDAV